MGEGGLFDEAFYVISLRLTLLRLIPPVMVHGKVGVCFLWMLLLEACSAYWVLMINMRRS
jgi:hypothetical protein